MAIEAIFFDIGDTLVTDRPTLEERIWDASQRCGIQFDRGRLTPALRRVEDFILEGYADGVTTDDAEVMVRAAQRFLTEVGASGTDRAVDVVQALAGLPFNRVLHPRALSMIDALKVRGFKIGVVSDWDPGLVQLLEDWELAPRLDGVAVSAIVGCTKPDPRLFRYAVSQAGVDPDKSLHVGDFFELDVAGARSAGMEALLFDWRGRRPGADCPRVETFEAMAEYLAGVHGPG